MLREIFKTLSQESRAELMYALEQELIKWIKLPDNKFIGVNIKALPQLQILETQGPWSYGILIGSNADREGIR